MQISLCFRIISFLKKANKLWVSTLRVQPNFCKTLHGKHEELWSSLWKNTLLYHSSGKGDPASPEKCALIFFFSSELNVHCFVCRFPSFWRRQRLPRYTIVQTVFKLGSNRTAFPSTDFVLVSYMGFSKAAWPLLFSWTEHPVYCVLGAVLLMRTLISYVLTFLQKYQTTAQT